MQEPDDYLYEVFVSYRHRPDDERWARRLQEVLETFETPRELVAEGVRARLGKVFVDDTEMAAGPELSRAIKAALWSSKWLIVVCSPDTPGSDWVRQEISLFRNAWGRRERTLALLTTGTPAQAYFGVNGEPVLHKNGFARGTRAYDPRGNVVEEAYFGVDSEPVLHKYGFARLTRAYDPRGNVVELAFFDVDGEPVLHKDGFARGTRAYDPRGNVVEESYFGIDGKPVLQKDGFAQVTATYDQCGNVVERACFGVDGEPILDKDGCARFTNAHDARGNVVEGPSSEQAASRYCSSRAIPRSACVGTSSVAASTGLFRPERRSRESGR